MIMIEIGKTQKNTTETHFDAVGKKKWQEMIRKLPFMSPKFSV